MTLSGTLSKDLAKFDGFFQYASVDKVPDEVPDKGQHCLSSLNTCERGRGRAPPDRLVLNEVAQVLQLDGEVDVVDRDLFRDLQDDGREIENPGDAAFHEVIRHF